MSFFEFKSLIKNYYKYIILFLVAIMIFIILFIVFRNNKKNNDKLPELNLYDQNIAEEKENSTITVDIKGFVNNPGVYTLNEGSRVIDLINISGGLTDEADTSFINLSKELINEMVVIIYSRDEIDSMNNGEKTIVKYVDKECICPNIKNDACVDSNKVTNIESNDKDDTSNIISINTADINDLQSLPGIGTSKAEAIIKYRETNGLFNSIEDIMNVSGIGKSIFEKIKNYITI